ncbi:unnamed protein product [Ranitomeya imitator]|uniref:Ycf15 n=1 Tax=Ranitomeya imitator TaxID=111125 RepID=A0ABN9M8W3_9NEOB|nr:unnamed protein product [Ranitomeya imitator]
MEPAFIIQHYAGKVILVLRLGPPQHTGASWLISQRPFSFSLSPSTRPPKEFTDPAEVSERPIQ